MRRRYLFLLLNLFLVLPVPVVLALFGLQLPQCGSYAQGTQPILVIRLHQVLHLVQIIIIIDRCLAIFFLLRVVASILMRVPLSLEEDRPLLVDVVGGRLILIFHILLWRCTQMALIIHNYMIIMIINETG